MMWLKPSIKFGTTEMNYDTIKTARLILEPFSGKHLSEKYVSWLNDPEVVKFSENRHQIHTLESCSQYVESFKGSNNFLWAIKLADNGEHIGNINAYWDINNNVADLGIMIGERGAWGKGFGYEAWQAVCDYLFAEKNVRKITGGCVAKNLGMIHIMRKSQMEEDGCRKQHHLLDGETVGVIHMAVFNPAVEK